MAKKPSKMQIGVTIQPMIPTSSAEALQARNKSRANAPLASAPTFSSAIAQG